jgi:hypothetical protein
MARIGMDLKRKGAKAQGERNERKSKDTFFFF